MRSPLAWLVLSLCVVAGCTRAPAPAVSTFDPDSIPDAFAVASSALWQAGTTRAYLLEPSGDLYNGSWRVRVAASANGALAERPERFASEERWLPVVHWRRHDGPVDWYFSAVAISQSSPADSALLVSLEVRASNRSSQLAHARLALSFENAGEHPPFLVPDVDSFPYGLPGWAPGASPALGWADGARGAVASAVWELPPAGTKVARFLLPAYPMSAKTLVRLARPTHAQRLADARRSATDELARGTAFELGDADTERALRAACRVLLAARTRRGDSWLPTGGPFQYRDTWLRDGARQIAALAVAGFTAESRQLARGLFVYQWPDGPFVSQRGQLDGTGQALWAIAQAELRPAPDSGVTRATDAALLAAGWLRRCRALGQTSGWPLARLLPFGDPRDNERVRAQLLGNDAWMIAGLEAGERLARAAQRGADADALAALRALHGGEFTRALARSTHSDIPPSWQGVGDDWGNLASVWPCRAVPADDPRAARLLRRVWGRSGGAGLTTFGSRDSLHGYVGADLGTWALLAGRPEQADSVLAALLHWRDAGGGGAELFSRNGGFGDNLPPHPTSAAALVMLVRNMLIHDDADSLHLTLGARSGWWACGRVRRAPTRWGLIDLSFVGTPTSADWNWTAVGVPTVLHLPPHTHLAVTPDAPLRASADGRAVVVPPGIGSARVMLAPDVQVARSAR